MYMSWTDLIFAHWTCDPEKMRRFVPQSLELDTFEGRAYLGIVPFMMTDVRPLRVPGLPGISQFLELNVRTYVTVDGYPGVFFFSLDAANPLAVWGAREFYYLPYFNARMKMEKKDGWTEYTSDRTHKNASSAAFSARYKPDGEPLPVDMKTLDRWLTERYCLYAVSPNQKVFRCDIHHPPWCLQPGVVQIERNTLVEGDGLAGLVNLDEPPLVHYSERQDTVAWQPVRVR